MGIPTLSIIVLPMSSSTNLHINKLRFEGMDYAPTASFHLLLKAYEAAKKRGARVYVGGMFSSDTFYALKDFYPMPMVIIPALAHGLEAQA